MILQACEGSKEKSIFNIELKLQPLQEKTIF